MRSLFGLHFSDLTQRDLVQALTSELLPADAHPRFVFTANLDHVVHLHRDKAFRRAYTHAWVRTIDGAPVFAYAKWRGARVPHRITGADLFPKLMRKLPTAARCFFVASSATAAERVAARLIARGFPAEAIAWDAPPFGFEADRAYSAALADRIRVHRTTHLFMGVGAPKSEIWLYRRRRDLGPCYALSVGAALEFFVGDKARAPRWMQKTGLEWAWRLGQEPRRLFRRYLINSWWFVAAVARDVLGRHDAPELERQ